MGDNLLELIIRTKDEASKQLEGVGKQIDDTSKKAEGLSQAFKVGGVMIAAALGATVAAVVDWSKKAADAQVETARYEAILKEASVTMSTHTTVIKGNGSAISAQGKALDAQIAQQQRQVQMLKLSGTGHEAEIKSIQGNINALKLQALQLEGTAVVKDKVIKTMGDSAGTYDMLKKKAEELSQSYIRVVS